MIEWVLGILTIPVVFWVLFLLEISGLIYTVEEENTFGAFCYIFFAGFLGVIEFGSLHGFITFIRMNPIFIGTGFILYLIFGTIWSGFKWFLFVRDKAIKIQETIDSNGYESAARIWKTYDIRETDILSSNFKCLTPKVREYKKKITTWIIFWIPSAIWFLLNNPIRRAANWIFEQVKDIFQAISNKAFKIN